MEQSAGMRLSRGQLWALAAAAAIVGLALVPLIATSDTASDRGLWIARQLLPLIRVVGEHAHAV